MAKMKVYELAKELDVQSKDVVAYLTENGSAVKSHASNIEDKEIDMVRNKFEKKGSFTFSKCSKSTSNNVIKRTFRGIKKKSNFEITLLFCFYLFYEKSHPKNNPSVNN